jgi:hypothetical protein
MYNSNLSGDDLPRRRRAPGRESTFRFGDDGSAAPAGGGGGGGAPPAGGGNGGFGGDPHALSQKERLAAERKARAAAWGAALRCAACDTHFVFAVSARSVFAWRCAERLPPAPSGACASRSARAPQAEYNAMLAKKEAGKRRGGGDDVGASRIGAFERHDAGAGGAGGGAPPYGAPAPPGWGAPQGGAYQARRPRRKPRAQ